jgi:hypothetical protein
MKINLRVVRAISLGIVFVFGVSGCSSVSTGAAGDQESEPSFPVKSVAENEFSFDRFDRQRAIKAYHNRRASLLFELVIDRDGTVTKIRVVRSNLDAYMTAAFKTHVSKGMKFTPAPVSDPQPYRTLYYLMSTKTEVETY